MINNAQFTVDVSRFVAKAKQDMDGLFRAIALEALVRVKELTPVKTGYLRANFVATLDPQSVRAAPGGSNSEAAIAQARAGDTIYIVNPVVYARRVEFGFVGEDSKGRAFNQPGRGMVQQVVTELTSIARRVARRWSGR